MSTMQRMTLIGMYNYDSTLFDSLSLPEGYDTQTFINSFLLEHGEKSVLYPNPNFMKFSIGVVSQKWYNELNRIIEALTAEYNPIENYDRYEDITDTTNGGTKSKVTAKYDQDRTLDTKDGRTANLTDTTTFNSNDTTEQLTSGTSEKQVAAYNSSTYEPSDKTIDNMGKVKADKGGYDTLTHTGTDDVTHTGTDKLHIEGTLTDRSDTNNNKVKHDGHIHGNIGVTTAAQMVNEILDQRTKNNLYSIAGNIFANELLIQIY